MYHSEYCKPTGSLRELVRPLVVNNVIQKQSRSPLEYRLFSTLISFGENKHNTSEALVVHHQQKWCVILRNLMLVILSYCKIVVRFN